MLLDERTHQGNRDAVVKSRSCAYQELCTCCVDRGDGRSPIACSRVIRRRLAASLAPMCRPVARLAAPRNHRASNTSSPSFTDRAVDVFGSRQRTDGPGHTSQVWRIRRECLDHVILANAAGLHRLLSAYITYYTRHWRRTRRSGAPWPCRSCASRASWPGWS